MGMYDEISRGLAERIITECPCCHKDLYGEYEYAEWQTKDFERILKTISLEDLDNDIFEMHTICPNCNKYMSAEVNIMKGIIDIRTHTFQETLPILDRTLIKDYKKSRLNRYSNKVGGVWLKDINVDYNDFVRSLDLDSCLSDIVDSIFDNYYIIPKKSLEDLEDL